MPLLREQIAPHLRRYVLGDTDSETLFFILLTILEQGGPLRERREAAQTIGAVKATVERVRLLCERAGVVGDVLLTFIVTDGDVMVAHQGGKELSFSTYKTRCPDRDECPSLSEVCEAPSKTGTVNHLIISSEHLQGHNGWEELAPGDVLGVDGRMRVVRTRVGRHSLRVLGGPPSSPSTSPPSSPRASEPR
jgi:glutamine amidotransferase